jgi:hypothetical protein
MDVDQAESCACLALIGWNPRQCDAIVAEGFTNIDNLGDMLFKDVSHICATISKLSNARGGVRIGCALVHRLKGFVWWVKDHQRRDQDAEVADWTLQVCKDSIDCMDMEDAKADNASPIGPPGKLKDGDWVQWELKLINFLQNVLGASGVPLHCVVCNDPPAGHQFANPAEALVHECPSNGLVCTEDNRKVHGIIKQSVADAQNWDWIETLNRAQDGRGAMTLLRTHFDGRSKVKKRIVHA